MIAVNKRILVKVDMSQKHQMLVGGVLLNTAIKYEKNFREKSPVLAEVITGNKVLKTGDIIVTHHNHFYGRSPYQLEDNLFSIPFNKTIFAKVSKKGKLTAICGNVLGERVPVRIAGMFQVEANTYIDRVLIKDRGWTSFKNGTTVICRPNAPYDIVYNFGGEERRITKLDCEMIVGMIIEK